MKLIKIEELLELENFNLNHSKDSILIRNKENVWIDENHWKMHSTVFS